VIGDADAAAADDDDVDDDNNCPARVLAGCSALGALGFGTGGDVSSSRVPVGDCGGHKLWYGGGDDDICAGVLFGSCNRHAGTLGFGGGGRGTSAFFGVRDNVT